MSLLTSSGAKCFSQVLSRSLLTRPRKSWSTSIVFFIFRHFQLLKLAQRELKFVRQPEPQPNTAQLPPGMISTDRTTENLNITSLNREIYENIAR